jgi:3-oxoacyl-[acyl-carrier protein] reductase
MRLQDKVAIVTGGQTGLGRTIARAFVKEGAHVVIADLVFDGAQKLAEEIEAAGRKSLAVRTDVTNPNEVKEMVDKTIEKFGRIDILVNNAGIIVRKSLLDHTLEEWNSMLAVNLTGIFLCTKEVLPHMIKQNGGKIINMASVGGMIGYAYPSYAATKAAVINLTRELVLETAPYNINTNCICPGMNRTSINEAALQAHPEIYDKIAKRIPAGRWGKGEGEEIGHGAVWLASEESCYCHGIQLVIDGGLISVIRMYD